MARWLKYLLVVIGILFLVCFYVGFQSYVTKSVFIISFYEVLSILISETWKLISTPTVFVALLIFLILRFYRTRIEAMFPAIKEITAGGVSAKFDFSQFNKMEDAVPIEDQSVSTSNSNQDQTTEMNDSSDSIVRAKLISLLNKNICRVLLSIDDKVLTTNEFIQKLDDEEVLKSSIKTDDKDKRYLFYAGVFRTLFIFVFPQLIDYKTSGDNKTAYINLIPGIRELIEGRLSELEKTSIEDTNGD